MADAPAPVVNVDVVPVYGYVIDAKHDSPAARERAVRMIHRRAARRHMMITEPLIADVGDGRVLVSARILGGWS